MKVWTVPDFAMLLRRIRYWTEDWLCSKFLSMKFGTLEIREQDGVERGASFGNNLEVYFNGVKQERWQSIIVEIRQNEFVTAHIKWVP